MQVSDEQHEREQREYEQRRKAYLARLAMLQGTMQAIEHACTLIQMHINPAEAEATILSLSQSQQPYEACEYILKNSKLANARFQAAAAIRNAAIREWGFISSDEKNSLFSFCLRYVTDHATSPDHYVLVKVSSVAAQLLKRGWLDFAPSEKEHFFTLVKKMISGGIYPALDALDVQFVGMNFLEHLVSEFSPHTSSAMGLPREFHEQCRKSLEQDHLKTFYCWARDAAVSVTKKIMESDYEVSEVRVCCAALRLMLQILNWDFLYSSSTAAASVFLAGGRQENDSSKRSECSLVQPGPSWREILICPAHVGWLLSLYAALRQKFHRHGYWLDCPIAVSTRKLIVQFCSLTGTVFPSDNVQIQEQQLLQLLSGIIPWIDPPDVIARAIENGRSDSEMLDGCRALLSIATITNPSVFDQLLKSTRPFGTITLLSTLMIEVVKSLTNNKSEEETWSWEARDILLDTWTALLVQVNKNGENTILPPEGRIGAANLFALIVESELKVAASSAFNDDDDDDSPYFQASISAMDERLSSYALIAREAADVTIPLLTGLFSERLARLNQGRGSVDQTETLEELYSLLLMIGHVIADEGEGETPLIPNAIQTQFSGISEAEKHPVIVLCSSIIKFAEQSLNSEIRASVFSPRLMEAVVWFLARWSSTYLMPPEENVHMNSGKLLVNFFGQHNQGKAVLDIIIRISQTALISYAGEKDLQAFTCHQLLHALVLRKHICIHLVHLSSWGDLANAFANDKSLLFLNATHQRSLARILVRSASVMRDTELSNQYVRDLMGHMATYFMELSRKSDIKKIALQPDIILMVSCLLERLRGAASASEPRTQKAIYELGVSLMNPVLVLLEAYKDESVVAYLLLKFVVDWVDRQISYLETPETATVVNFCMSLLQLYSTQNVGKISIALSGSLLSEANTEKYKDLRALLQLLSHLCSKDLVDFSSDSVDNTGTSISQVVYFGLHIITPLISLDLLKYPKLCYDYFSLLSHLLEVYPETVPQLNADAFAHVLGTLEFGLHHQDIEVMDMCLRALRSLASYHYSESRAGKIGLESHAKPSGPNHGGTLQESVLSRFLRSLLQLLLFEDYSPDLVSGAADALLPLLLCEQALYQSLGNELIEREPNPALKSRLANALHTLTSANQLSSNLDRKNYQIFRKNLTSFLIEVRGFLRTK